MGNSMKKNKYIRFFAWILFPLTMWYGIGVWFRNKLFDIGLLRGKSVSVTTIGVGNLAAGGTGKTPMVEYLLTLFADKYHVAMLSRGYRRNSHGFVLAEEEADPNMIGDESAMVAGKFPQVKVAVCEDRMAGVHQLEESGYPVDMVVLDDVLQHRFIKPTLTILLTEYRHPYCDDAVIPFGTLREGRYGSRRADIVVVTKSPEKPHPVEVRNLTRRLNLRSYQRLFFSYIKYGKLQSLYGEGTREFTQQTQILVMTGIAHPESLMQYLNRKAKLTPLLFGDHHRYSERDAAQIREAFQSLPGTDRMILTTEKDAIKLRGEAWQALLGDLPIYYLPIQMAFCGSDGEKFDHILMARVAENIHFRKLIRSMGGEPASDDESDEVSAGGV
mgnify:CR=1 FL=1